MLRPACKGARKKSRRAPAGGTPRQHETHKGARCGKQEEHFAGRSQFPEGREHGWAVKADALEGLLGMIDIDAETTLATLEKYNAAAAGEAENELGCSPETKLSVTVPPFYAVTIHAVRTNPRTGPKVVGGGSTQIADASGQGIPNPYGAGTLVGPNLFYYRYFQYCGGLTTALAVGHAAGAEARDTILNA